MTLRTSSSRLKAKLGQYMKAVRAGKVVIVTDRDQPIARLVPYAEPPSSGRAAPVIARPREPGAQPLGQVEVRAVRYGGTPTIRLLLEDRARR